MAKTPTDDSPRQRKRSPVIVWALMGLILLGFGGFGVTNFSGSVRSIGSVGDQDISTTDYALALQNQIAVLSQQAQRTLTMQEAVAFGIDQQVLDTLVTGKALVGEAKRLGVSAGDARVAKALTVQDAFLGVDGKFDRDTYLATLDRNTLTPGQYEATLRDDMARNILQGAVVSGIIAPAALTDTLYAYGAERRSLTLLQLTEADLPTPLPDPSAPELNAYYAENVDDFTLAEAKRITYAALLPDALAATMQVDEVELRKMYDDRLAEFVQPEKRLVERLVYPTESDAAAAKARLDAGETFEALVAERGLTLDDIDLGDVSETDLGAAGKAIYELREPGVVGPLRSDLGPALFRMNAILAAQETTFEDARPDLLIEYQQAAARRAIGLRIEEVDDLLAGGATLENLAKDAGMTLETIDYRTDSDAAIAGYPAFRAAADALAEGDFPEAVLLEDGGLVALRLDAIIAPAPIPFDAALPQVTEAWRASARARALTAQAAEIKAGVEGGGSLASYGILSVSPEFSRQSTIDGTPEGFGETVFGMAESELRIVEGPLFVGIVRLDAIKPASGQGDAAEALKTSIAAQVEQAIARDLFALYGQAVSTEAGVTLNRQAIEAVNAQLP